MNYSQNTGSTNSTKKLLCVWVNEELYEKLCTTAKNSNKNYTEIVVEILNDYYNDY